MRQKRFTLIELLVVCSILVILTGLILSTVFNAQKQARITRVKADMAAITLALRNAQMNYGSFVNTANNSFNGAAAILATSKNQNDTWVFRDAATDALLVELSTPENPGLASLNFNTQKRVFLEPRSDFDPSKNYQDQPELLWRDPWGNPYVIAININGDKYIDLAEASTGDPRYSKVMATDIAIYSFGPNGEDDRGCDTNDPSGQWYGQGMHRVHDDITSWQK